MKMSSNTTVSGTSKKPIFWPKIRLQLKLTLKDKNDLINGNNDLCNFVFFAEQTEMGTYMKTTPQTQSHISFTSPNCNFVSIS